MTHPLDCVQSVSCPIHTADTEATKQSPGILNSLNNKNSKLEMWANAQLDGRPAEYRWCPLFNATKFG